MPLSFLGVLAKKLPSHLEEQWQTMHHQGKSLKERESRPKEVVLLVIEEQPRGTWMLGINEDIIPDIEEKT